MKKFKLIRVSIGPHGAFGVLIVEQVPIAVTLEHAFDISDIGGIVGVRVTAISPGNYVCPRGRYNKGGYATYEIPVPRHTEIKFHKGNRDDDSAGCILVGAALRNPPGGDPFIAESALGFAAFMAWAADAQEIELEVIDAY